jgi:hypothetical protein
MVDSRPDSWTAKTYNDQFRRIFEILPDLRDEIESDVQLVTEDGYHVVDTSKSMDMAYWKNDYIEFIQSHNAQKPCVAKKINSDGCDIPGCELYKISESFNKKVVVLGRIGIRWNEGEAFKVTFTDLSQVLSDIMEKVYGIERKQFATNEYHPTCHLVRPNMKWCTNCMKEFPDSLETDKCKHVYTECKANGEYVPLADDREVEQYLQKYAPGSGEVTVVAVGRMSYITVFSKFKFVFHVQKVYIPSQDVRDKVHELRKEEVKGKRRAADLPPEKKQRIDFEESIVDNL